MFKPYISNETLLFPPCLGDFIPQDSPVRLISDIAERLNLKPIIDSYSPSDDGQPPYNPLMLLKAVIYGYMCNVFSTRGLEDVMARDLHMIWLSSYQFPDHSTISRFKTRCMPHIKDIFGQLVQILVEKGEIQLSKELYIDGTTIRSKASRYRIKWRKNAEKFGALAEAEVKEALEDLLKQAEEAEVIDADYVAKVDRTPEDAKKIATEIETRLADKKLDKTTRSIRAKIKKVKEADQKKKSHQETLKACNGRCGISPTDPDSGILHAKEDGYDGKSTPNYNLQIATQNQYVTNFDTFSSTDQPTAMDFIETCIKENGVTPEAVVEDAGYGCEEVYVGMEGLEIEAVVKYKNYDRECSRERRPLKEGQFDKTGFKLSQDGKGLVCPKGNPMRVTRVEADYSKRGFRSDITHFTCDHCEGCPFTSQCPVCTNKNREIGRKLGNMREERKAKKRLDKPKNQERLKRRSLEPEAVFGQLKYNHGYTRFRHFSKPKVNMDLGFELMALNILKLYKNTKK